MPKKKKPTKRPRIGGRAQAPLYKSPPPKPKGRARSPHRAAAGSESQPYHPIPSSHFQLREDGSIQVNGHAPTVEQIKTPPPKLAYSSDSPFIRLYHGNCLELLDAIYARHGDAGRFDAIFADPPYFLSNGGISCHAGKMVKVDKGDWDKSRGAELNHEFNTEWLARCQRVLKPNGTIWVSGTHHVIFSIGYAMQQLGYKILNDIAWEKPNPPPNLSCRYFTHSTETILWAAKNDKSKHVFNYQDMRKVTGKQMKTVWRRGEFHEPQMGTNETQISGKNICENLCESVTKELNPVWTMTAPGGETPNFYFLQYDFETWMVRNLLLVPYFAFPASAIIKRPPLAPTARRAGWVGCNFDLRRIPAEARIEIISTRSSGRESAHSNQSRLTSAATIIVPSNEVRAQFKKVKPLKELSVKERGWTLDVLNGVRSLGKKEFTNTDAYTLAGQLEKLHPDNRHVRDKIRQQLQVLRDAKLLIHVSPAVWRLL